MAKNPIKFSTILKRSQCLNSIHESTKVDSDRLYENLTKVLEKSRTGKENGVQQILRSYLESMCNSDNANSNYWQILNLVTEFNKLDSNVSDKIIYEFINRSLPYMERPSSVIECIDNYELESYQRDIINEAVCSYNVADRIVKNHNMISKRFNIDKSVSKYRSTGLKYFIDSCIDMIDTYNIPKYQKMNIALEECYYLLEKNGIKEDKETIAKCVLEHFLMSCHNISDKDMNNYKRVINESYILNEYEADEVNYIFETREINSVESGINKFMINGIKDENSLTSMISSVLKNTSKDDIVYNADKLFDTLWDLTKNEVFESDESIYKAGKNIINYISETAKLEGEVLDKSFSKEDVTSIIGSLDDITIMIKTAGNSNADYARAADRFIKECIEPSVDTLVEVKNLLYNKANIDAIKYVNNESVETIPLNEFKLFKFHNLVRAAFNLDKFLKVKEKKFYTKSKIKFNNFKKKAKHVLFGESADVEASIYNYIGEDCKADICVRQYPYNEYELESVIEYLESVCYEYNDVLLSQNETCRAYFIINPGLAEVRIKESAMVKLEDSDVIYRNLDPAMDTYFEGIIEADHISDTIEKFKTNSIEDSIANIVKCKEFTLEQFELALEAMSIIGIDKDMVSVFGDKFNSFNFNYALDKGLINESYIGLAAQERKVSNLINEFTNLESVEFEDKVEAYKYLNQIFEYSYPSSSDDEDDDESSKPEVKKASSDKKESNKKPSEIYKDEVKAINDMKNKPPKKAVKSGGLNLNNIKLAIMGLKEKYKTMSTKEKEFSRNMDAATRSMIKAMKDSLVSDRREAIIKGSVIPSFSRCMKAAIPLVILGCFSLPAAIVAAIGGFALSKKLTEKERLLLLDEIETEVEVIDKELALADSNNDIQKYRALLQYKKDLQRQYQRIRYNIRVGKDVLTGSATGFAKRED